MYNNNIGLPEHFTIKYEILILSERSKQNEFVSHVWLEKR